MQISKAQAVDLLSNEAFETLCANKRLDALEALAVTDPSDKVEILRQQAIVKLVHEFRWELELIAEAPDEEAP